MSKQQHLYMDPRDPRNKHAFTSFRNSDSYIYTYFNNTGLMYHTGGGHWIEPHDILSMHRRVINKARLTYISI